MDTASKLRITSLICTDAVIKKASPHNPKTSPLENWKEKLKKKEREKVLDNSLI